jgi:cold shock protein
LNIMRLWWARTSLLTLPARERRKPSGNQRVSTVNGTVKFYNATKGFGFIEPDEGGKDVFVHATALEASGIRALNEGDRVSFELVPDRKGRGQQAAQVKLV